jgi:putative ABC transport system permease protein
VDLILVQSISADAVPQVMDEVSQILRSRHRSEIGKDDFTIFSQQDFLDFAASITGVLTIFLGGIAAISLLVGGIGIMNIMLVSVIERTREIGLRKAMGARKRDIMIQFLTESSLLSLIGGLLGVGLGWLIGAIVGQIAAMMYYWLRCSQPQWVCFSVYTQPTGLQSWNRWRPCDTNNFQ